GGAPAETVDSRPHGDGPAIGPCPCTRSLTRWLGFNGSLPPGRKRGRKSSTASTTTRLCAFITASTLRFRRCRGRMDFSRRSTWRQAGFPWYRCTSSKRTTR
ncbi:unnamed protein product, partial [Ectocarpus sp. 12 AP-2014]